MKQDYINLKHATLCSIAFLGLYVAVYSTQNVQSQIYDIDGYKNLGYISNAVAYLGQGLGSIFCVYVMQRVGDVKAMAYSSLLSLPFIICLILPALNTDNKADNNFFFSQSFVTILTIYVSFLNGFGGGINQPASGKYISDCATENTKGFFFAFFWSFYMGSQVIGNIISAFALGYFEQYYYVLIMAIICFCSGMLLFFLKQPEVHHNVLRSVENVTLNAASNQSIDPLNQLMIDAIQAHNTLEEQSLKDNIKSLWGLVTQKRFRLFIPQLCWSGVSIAFYSGNLVELMALTVDDDEQVKFKKSMLAMIAFGAGEVLGCFFIGFFVDKFGSKVASVVNIILVILMTLSTLGYCIAWQYGWQAFLMCFLWGFQDSATNTHSQEILGFEFDNNFEPFSVYNILQCICCATLQIVEISVQTRRDYIIFTVFIGVIGVFCCSTMLFFDFREHKHGNTDQHEQQQLHPNAQAQLTLNDSHQIEEDNQYLLENDQSNQIYNGEQRKHSQDITEVSLED
ncbi:major facilitator superfamily protein [Stylonychia lemnae]|uniref:Major facilitator superfamily protein n=1 Tax=Stylonychia lemnae TaxID=5949 RepID=A0A078AG14_STYLE|nr:major facilitator superfamily protein [Stylonychia lemnae]|eukprot:CDW81164.1 major facilitator superfamily protein [Stylonychia lemnae]